MSLLPLPLLMGFLGSLHCALMCGPIVLALPLNKKNNWYGIFQLLLYQLGRIIVYTVLGVLVGLVGSVFKVFVKQEVVSLVIGILLIAIAVLHWQNKKLTFLNNLQAKMMFPVSRLMGKIFNLPMWGFFAGMLNGIIPCGMVYLALVTALNLASPLEGASFMLLFGLGTTPLMLLITIGGVYLKRYFKLNSQKLIPWFAIGLGALFVLRAANLNIPFLSPTTHFTYGKAVNCGF